MTAYSIKRALPIVSLVIFGVLAFPLIQWCLAADSLGKRLAREGKSFPEKPAIVTTRPSVLPRNESITRLELAESNTLLRVPRLYTRVRVGGVIMCENQLISLSKESKRTDPKTDCIVLISFGDSFIDGFLLFNLGKLKGKEKEMDFDSIYESIRKQKDIEFFRSAMKITRGKLAAAANNEKAVMAFMLLRLRGNVGPVVQTFQAGRNTIFLGNNPDSTLGTVLWVFSSEGEFLGNVYVRKADEGLAIAIAASMQRIQAETPKRISPDGRRRARRSTARQAPSIPTPTTTPALKVPA